MRRSIIHAVTVLILSGACVQTEAGNLLQNGGFKIFKVGDVLPVKGWFFTEPRDKMPTGKFINDNSFKGEGPILEMISHNDKKAVLYSRSFKIKESGTYRASIWIKTGADAKAIPKKRFSVRMRIMGLKKRLWSKFQVLQKAAYLKYTYEFYVPESDLGKCLFRIDIFGSGTFFLAAPSVEKTAYPR